MAARTQSKEELREILTDLQGDETPEKLPRPDSTSLASPPKLDPKMTDPRNMTRPSTASKIVVQVGAGLEFDPTFASFGKRALGAIVDAAVLALAILPGLLILSITGGVVGNLLSLFVMLLGLAVIVVLGARSIAATGKWIGNRVAGTTVVDAINGSFIDTGRAALRMFARHVISPLFLFGYIVAFTDSQRQTFHDRLVSSVVITRPREVWTAEDG